MNIVKRTLAGLAIGFIVATAVCLALVATGCTSAELQKASGDFTNAGSKVTSAAGASTLPVVRTIETVAPVATPYIELGATALSLIGAALTGAGGLIGGIAGTAATAAVKNTTITAQTSDLAATKSTLVEVFDSLKSDVEAFKNPSEPWSAVATKVIADVVGLTQATPAPVPTAATQTTVT